MREGHARHSTMVDNRFEPARRVTRGRTASWLIRRLRQAGRSDRATAIVEFALVLPVLMSLIFGTVEFGMALTTDIALTNATRTAARWATVHPTAWSNAASAPSNTIEGQLQQAEGISPVPNDDSHIKISYLAPTSGSPTECGYYSAGSGGFVGENGYSQSTCVVAGTLINIQVTDKYTFMTELFQGMFPNGLTLQTSTAMLEEI